MLLRAHHYVSSEPIDVVVDGGVIRSSAPAGDQTPDFQADWIAPAFFDLQINGCDGHNFTSEKLTPDSVHHVVQVCRAHGVAGLLPTLITGPFEAVAHGLKTIHDACEQDRALRQAIAGIHLEGPYISAESGPRGAHPKSHVRPPDWDEFRRWQDAAQGQVRLMTLAPELPGAIGLIEKLVASGVTVALGHTAADHASIRAAIAAGARLSTHLGNGSHAVLPRHDNYLWEQLAADELWASIIADGQHLPATLVKCIVRVKTPGRLILTCDASPLAGLPPGRYREWEQDFDVLPEGKIVVSGTPYLGGSWHFTDHCVGNLLRFTDVSLGDAIDMAGARPRELLGLPKRSLEAGMPADLILFDWRQGEDVKIRQLPLAA